MSASYPGNAGNVTAHEAPSIIVPVDSDPNNAASVAGPLETLADYAAYLQANAALLDQANVFTQPQAIQPSITGLYTLVQSFDPRSSFGFMSRVYMDSAGAFYLVWGCSWNQSNTRWEADTFPAVLPWYYRLNIANGSIDRAPTSAPYWADSAWVGQPVPQAKGIVKLATDGTTTLQGNHFGLGTPSPLVSGGTTVVVPLSPNLSDGNYIVNLTCASMVEGSVGLGNALPYIVSQSGSQFEFSFATPASGGGWTTVSLGNGPFAAAISIL